MGSTTSSARNQGSRNANPQNKAQTAAQLQTRLLDPRSPTTTVARTPLSSASHCTRITNDDGAAPCFDLTESCDEVDKKREMAAVNDIMRHVQQSKQRQQQQQQQQQQPQGPAALLDAIDEEEEREGGHNDDECSMSTSSPQQREEEEEEEREEKEEQGSDQGVGVMGDSTEDGGEGTRYFLLDDACASPSSHEENTHMLKTQPDHTPTASSDAPATALEDFATQQTTCTTTGTSTRMKRQTPLGERTNFAPALRA